MIQIKEDGFLVYPYERIESVSDDCILIRLKKETMTINGHHLKLSLLSPHEVMGQGKIAAIIFSNQS